MSTTATEEPQPGPVQPPAPPTSTRRRRLTQIPAALALGIGLLAVPGLPMLANAVLPEREWNPIDPGEEVSLVSAAGNGIRIDAPTGWQALDQGDSAVLRSGDAVVLIQVYDRADRDPAAMAQRLMRANRIQGISAAPDGGKIASADGTLRGDTCVVVTTAATGTCAFVADDDVVISVLSLGKPTEPALPIGKVVDLISKEQQ